MHEKIFSDHSVIAKKNKMTTINLTLTIEFCLQLPKSPTQMESLSVYNSVRNISHLGSFKDISIHHHLERLLPLTKQCYMTAALCLSAPPVCVCVCAPQRYQCCQLFSNFPARMAQNLATE
jgi:hypothetical protein